MITVQEWVARREWASEDQRKGFLALLQHLHRFEVQNGVKLGIRIEDALVASYFIQKDHESNEWWRDTVASQVDGLRREIDELRTLNRVRSLEIDGLREEHRRLTGDRS